MVFSIQKYFAHDDEWNTLFDLTKPMITSANCRSSFPTVILFVPQPRYVVIDLACGEDQYGPMIELLIRDYAADRDDPLFPRMRT